MKSLERIEDLQLKGLRIIRRTDRPGYSTDAVLLADFARLRPKLCVCDLGCGIGILPLLLIGREAAIKVTGLELQPDLAELARRSVKLNGLAHSVDILTGDLRNVQALLPAHSFDAVISNPPYFAQGGASLEKQQGSCSFDDLAKAAAYLLKPGGRLYLSAPAEALLLVADALKPWRLEPKRLQLVSSLPGKAPYLCLIEAKQGARPGLRLLPVLQLLEAPGIMTGAARRIYHIDKEEQA